MPPVYHLLDPLWSRLPLPVRGRCEEVTVGPLRALRMHRALFGRGLLDVYVYAVGDTLVDTGIASLGDRVVAWARERGATRAVLTHHHEDHVGNAARLLREGVEVRATPLTAAMTAAGFPIPFYEHLAWGKPPPAAPLALPDALPVDGTVARVIPAPGHCPDQVCLHLPERGWLFSGDVFLHERVKLFRRDEDFAGTVATLERLLALDFDALWCAHRPRPVGGRAALAAKLQHLRDIEGRVRAAHARGRPPRAIAREVIGASWPFELLSAGDASPYNLVHSILYGPRPRPELRAFPPAGGGSGPTA